MLALLELTSLTVTPYWEFGAVQVLYLSIELFPYVNRHYVFRVLITSHYVVHSIVICTYVPPETSSRGASFVGMNTITAVVYVIIMVFNNPLSQRIKIYWFVCMVLVR